jgi:hypothetical protein
VLVALALRRLPAAIFEPFFFGAARPPVRD